MNDMRELSIGDRVRVFGGYEPEPQWLKGRSHYDGTVERFIPGQGDQPAAVIRLDEPIELTDATGTILIVELAWEDTTWATPMPRVHLELCDFDPESRPWAERQQGRWIESHATYALSHPAATS